MRIGFEYDDNVHSKLRVIASQHKQSLLSFIREILSNYVAEFEKQYGEVKIFNDKS